MEITKGIFQASQNIYQNNKSSLLRTVIYTIGHFAIAITAVSYTHLTMPTTVDV